MSEIPCKHCGFMIISFGQKKFCTFECRQEYYRENGHYNEKLNFQQKKEIIYKRMRKSKIKDLAKEYGVGVQTISRIIKKKH